MSRREIISNKQGIALIILFINGEASIFIEGICAKSDTWLALILGLVMSLPMVLIFARLLSLFPEKSLFDIVEICLGKILGKVFILVYTWFCFHAVAITLEDWVFFVKSATLPDTPNWVIIGLLILLCAYGVKQGIEVLGRWSEMFVVITVIEVIAVFFLLLPKFHWDYLTPVLYEGPKPVFQGAFLTFLFPMTYIVGFLPVLSLRKEKNSAYKIFFYGLLIGSAILFLIYIGVILTLGPYNASRIYYPTYVKVSLISIGNFLQRLDILAAVVYISGIFIQTSIFLMGACRGFAKLFVFPDYRFIVWPMTLLAATLAIYEPGSIMNYFEFAIDAWPYYVFPFEVILPLCLWIVAEIRVYSAGKQGRILGS